MADGHDRHQTVVTVFCVLLRENQVLLIRRARPPYQGTCTIPGGHKCHGESLRQACAREMAEETGFQVANLEFAGFLEIEFPGDPRDFLSFYFVSRDFTGTMTAGSEGEIFWADVDQAPNLPGAHPAFQALAPYFLHGRGPFEGRAVVDRDGRGEYSIILQE